MSNIYEATFLQSVVAPVGIYIETPEQILVQQIFGTGFFIDASGHFLTARHVLDAAKADAAAINAKLGIFPMQVVGDQKVNLTAPIVEIENAPLPFDITLGRAPYHCKTFFELARREVEVWQDVATMGYPTNTSEKTAAQYRIQQRAHKGYIQRCIPSERMTVGTHPDCFEVNFPITEGMSGAPLFIHRGALDDLIGICVGSVRSQIVDYQSLELTEDGGKYSEKTMRIEEYGIAHDIRGLLDWKPVMLAGKSLFETSSNIAQTVS